MIAHRFSRRGILCGTASLAALAASGQLLAGPAQRLPQRGHFVIRNAFVMTMERDTGDIAGCDVQVRDGTIVAVGPKLNVQGAATINGEGMIVLPGLVETHWHMWNTLLRSMSGEKPDFGYFRTTSALGRAFEPSDMYKGTRLAAAEAINSGITHVHDWCHNIRTPEHARADLRALKEAGLRGRFSYGPMQGHDVKTPIDLADIEKLKEAWAEWSEDDLLTLGMAWRGQGGNNPATAVPE